MNSLYYYIQSRDETAYKLKQEVLQTAQRVMFLFDYVTFPGIHSSRRKIEITCDIF